MKCLLQPEPLEVKQFAADTWVSPRSLRTHYELISIRAGSGEVIINQQSRRYRVGSLFLLAPADAYSFSMDQTTSFGVLRFTETYLTALTATGIDAGAWQQLRDETLHASLGLAGTIELDTTGQQQVEALLSILFLEFENRGQPFKNTLAESLMGAVLSFVGRRLSAMVATTQLAASRVGNFVQRLLAHIRRHIAQPDFLRVKRLAAEFACSPKHLSALFKQETGESLRQYILRYKLQLVETRLLLSTLTVSQIADELAFTDVCHLNKQFKKHYDTTPTDYRRLSAINPASV